MKKKIVEYDETKKMLRLLRNLNEEFDNKKNNITKLNLTEAPEPNNDDVVKSNENLDDLMVINGVEVTVTSEDKDDLKFDTEDKNTISGMIDNFKSQVSQIVDFEPGLTIAEKQIRLDGQLTDQEIGFVYVAGVNGGMYLNTDMAQITPETVTIIEKLNKFQEVFKSTMEPLIDKLSNN
jgi:hypothetical protein